MSRQTLLGVSLALTLLLSLMIAGASRAAQAQDLPPRPTDVPVPTAQPTPPTAQPTAAPRPTERPRRKPERERDRTPTLLFGRITGTVIDQTTGAPVPGVRVAVGALTVTTDLNGNYDRPGLADDTYDVTLLPAEGFGAPAQATMPVTITDGATVVQHLAFQPHDAARFPKPARVGSAEETTP